MASYYNEIDPFAAKWLRNLISLGVIAAGDVDERSIEDVLPSELSGYTQCHFFAGIGVWSHALRKAGFDDDRAIWTGSCPCQPFSEAGKGRGHADERHLWPAFFHLIEQCRPPVVIGEQVEGAVKHGWVDLVQSDLEGAGYSFGFAGLPAACVGAPHIRGRLFWVGNSNHKGLEGHPGHGNETGRQNQARPTAETSGSVHRLGDSDSNGRGSRGITSAPSRYGNPVDTTSGGMFNPDQGNGFWGDAEWAYCRDGKFRPIEPGTFPLAPRSPTHMGRCRAYGNSTVSQVATEFIKACSLV